MAWLRFTASLVVLISLLAIPATAQRGRDGKLFSYDELWDSKNVSKLLAEAEGALAAELNQTLKPKPRFLLSSREHVYGIMLRRVRKQIKVTDPDKAKDEKYIQDAARSSTLGVLGFYDPPTQTVHLVPENFEGGHAADLGMISNEFLRCVVVHELVHAYDQQNYKIWDKFFTKDVEKLRVWQALTEGHAQFVTQRVMDRFGSMRHFLHFTKTNFAVPVNVPEAFRHDAEVRSRRHFFAYVKGHKFFERLAFRGDPKFVDALFKNPPKNVSVILHPSRYYNPLTGRPPVLDFEPELRALLKQLEPRWDHIEIPYDESMFQASFGELLPEKTVDEIGEHFVGGSLVVAHQAKLLRRKEGKKQKLKKGYAACTVNQMDTAEAATQLLQHYIDASAEEDARFKAGKGEITFHKAGKLSDTSKVPHWRIIKVKEYKDSIRTLHWFAFTKGPMLASCEFHMNTRSDPEMVDLIKTLRPTLNNAVVRGLGTAGSKKNKKKR